MDANLKWMFESLQDSRESLEWLKNRLVLYNVLVLSPDDVG